MNKFFFSLIIKVLDTIIFLLIFLIFLYPLDLLEYKGNDLVHIFYLKHNQLFLLIHFS